VSSWQLAIVAARGFPDFKSISVQFFLLAFSEKF
jgi:hypothetical protein